MTVGIVGLGMMGLSIAANLLNKGYDVIGYDINPARSKLLTEKGGQGLEHCAQVGSRADAVILMVFNAQQMEDVLFGSGKLADTLKPGSVVVVTASVGKDVCEQAAPKLAAQGIDFIDAPLMASCESALSGDMHIILGAKKSVLEKWRSLLDDMSEELYFMGELPGQGQMAKTCLQTFFSFTFEQASEVMALGEKCHIDMEELYRLLNNSPASSVLFQIAAQNIKTRTFTGTNNPLSILDKDMKLSLCLGKELDVKMPGSAGISAAFSEAMDKYPAEDIWATVKVAEN